MNLAGGYRFVTLINGGARKHARLAALIILSLTTLIPGSGHTADLGVRTGDVRVGAQYIPYAGEAEASALRGRGFDRQWNYLSAEFERGNSYAIGASWLPNAIAVGISSNVRDSATSHCTPLCTSSFTNSTFGRLGVSVDESFFYVWGGLEHRSLMVLPQLDRSYYAIGAGLITPFGTNGQFYLEFEQRMGRYDCGATCGMAALSSKSDDYIVRAGLRQDFAGLSDFLKGLFFPTAPATPQNPTKFHGPR